MTKAMIDIATIAGPEDSGKDIVISKFHDRYYHPYVEDLGGNVTSEFRTLTLTPYTDSTLKVNDAIAYVSNVIDRILAKHPVDDFDKPCRNFIFIHCNEPDTINKLYGEMSRLTAITRSSIHDFPVEINVHKIGIVRDINVSEIFPSATEDVVIDATTERLRYLSYPEEDLVNSAKLDMILLNRSAGIAAASCLAEHFHIRVD